MMKKLHIGSEKMKLQAHKEVKYDIKKQRRRLLFW